MTTPKVTVPGSGATNIGSSIQELELEVPLARALKKALDDARSRAKVASHVASGGKLGTVGEADSLEIVELHQNPHKVEVRITATFPCSALPAKVIAKPAVQRVAAPAKAAPKAAPKAKKKPAKGKKR